MKSDPDVRDLIHFPIIFNVVGIVSVALLFAFSPEHVVEQGVLNAVLYTGVLVTHWSLFYIVVRRLGTRGLRELIVPKIEFNWGSSIAVFVALNGLFIGYIVLALVYGRIPPWGQVDAPQMVFYLVINPLTAGFVEEIIWRGYFIEKLIASGRTERSAIMYSAASFAFTHGIMIWDKLIVTFIWGLIAGLYYVRERNIPVLMTTHIVIDVIAF